MTEFEVGGLLSAVDAIGEGMVFAPVELEGFARCKVKGA